jgi:hypothetical protein
MAATFDPSGGCSVDRQASGWGGFSRDRGTYKRLLHAAVRRLAGKPRRPWAVTLTRMIQAVTFGVIVAVIFLAVIFWKSEQDRKRHEQEDHWRRELYHAPPYR